VLALPEQVTRLAIQVAALVEEQTLTDAARRNRWRYWLKPDAARRLSLPP